MQLDKTKTSGWGRAKNPQHQQLPQPIKLDSVDKIFKDNRSTHPHIYIASSPPVHPNNALPRLCRRISRVRQTNRRTAALTHPRPPRRAALTPDRPTDPVPSRAGPIRICHGRSDLLRQFCRSLTLISTPRSEQHYCWKSVTEA